MSLQCCTLSTSTWQSKQEKYHKCIHQHSRISHPATHNITTDTYTPTHTHVHNHTNTHTQNAHTHVYDHTQHIHTHTHTITCMQPHQNCNPPNTFNIPIPLHTGLHSAGCRFPNLVDHSLALIPPQLTRLCQFAPRGAHTPQCFGGSRSSRRGCKVKHQNSAESASLQTKSWAGAISGH